MQSRASSLVPDVSLLWSSCNGDPHVFSHLVAVSCTRGPAAARACLASRCPHCGARASVTTRLIQTRSADEGETAYHNCVACNKTWTT